MFLLVKLQTDCSVLKSKELELVAGKLVRKERQSVFIAVQSRATWLRATHQQPTKSAAKIKKAAVKRSPTEQKLLGRFFDKAKNHSRTKPASKARVPTTVRGQEISNVGPKELSEDRLGALPVTNGLAPTCAQNSMNETYQIEAVGAHVGQTVEQFDKCHSEPPLIADSGKTLSGGNQDVIKRGVVKADYGVISLFDGSTVVPTLHKKFGYPPTLILLAEIDVSLRALVCAEFGYRPDQTWGRTKHGSACLYVKDVNSLLEDNCRRLYETVAIVPNAKWIIVGGSPCQDLTFAGAFRGLLGLVGKNRLFFTLLGVIRAMQDLVTKKNVRFLVKRGLNG